MNSRYLPMDLRTSPHFSKGVSVEVIMRNVIYALVPIVVFSVYSFGWSVLLLFSSTTVSCLLTEHFFNRLASKENTLQDYSAAITGILLGLTLPPGFPLWMAGIGGFVSIALGKVIFGGLGFNLFNPALVGRAFLQAAFPMAITTWTQPLSPDRWDRWISTTLAFPFTKSMPDVVSGATPLSAMKFDHQLTAWTDLFWGRMAGSSGETCAALLLLGGIYLAARKMLDWRIPIGIFGSVFLWSSFFHWIHPSYPPPLFMLFSGGLMLGGIFMATDMVTSPVTPIGIWIYAALIGTLVVFIRWWGGLPEGVMYAILLGNALTPLLNRLTPQKVYGFRRKQ